MIEELPRIPAFSDSRGLTSAPKPVLRAPSEPIRICLYASKRLRPEKNTENSQKYINPPNICKFTNKSLKIEENL